MHHPIDTSASQQQLIGSINQAFIRMLHDISANDLDLSFKKLSLLLIDFEFGYIPPRN
jgi:hypothetical protein